MSFKKIYIKNEIKKILWIGFFIFSCIHFANAQDLHFSQFYNSPLTTNPANTGFMPDADYRVGGNYRKQWATVPVPYKTMSFFADGQVGRNKLENGWIGVGGVLLKDEAGTGALQSTKVYGSVAYHQIIGENNLLSLGAQVGMVQKSINTTKLTFDNMWNGKFFDIKAPSGETFAATSIRYADLNMGLNYAAFPTEDSYLNVGFSVQHINRPKETFFDGVLPSGSTYDNRLARRYTAFFNGSFKLNDQVIVNPQAYASYMLKAYEINAGVNVQYNLTGEGGQSQLIGGIYYRLKDAIIPMVGIKHKSITATFTYDATVSKLATFNSVKGGSEISIIYTGILTSNNSPKNMRCKSPSF
jgi:type IX secretion system PorP/SprF family membrane protein